jgi:hypothetical protein
MPTSSSPAVGEVLGGTPTGTTGSDGLAVFTLAHAPTDPAQVAIFNGTRKLYGVHYTISGQNVTFLSPYIPLAGDIPIADYPWGTASPAGTDLTSLVNVKLWLGIANSDTSSDAILSRLISTESAAFVLAIGRNILSQAYVETIDGSDPRIRRGTGYTPWGGGVFPGGGGYASRGWAVDLENWPVISVTSVVVNGETIPAGSNPGQSTQVDGWMLVDSYRIELLGATYSFSGGIQNVAISYNAGYSAVPADIDQAICELVAYRYQERNHVGQRSKTGVAGESIVFTTDVVPPSVQAVIDSYRRVNI